MPLPLQAASIFEGGRQDVCPSPTMVCEISYFVIEIFLMSRSLLNVTALNINIAC